MSDLKFEHVKVLVEQLPPAEVERLRAWLNEAHEPAPTDARTWGERLVALVNEFDLDEADQIASGDPETWVREQRRTQTERRNPGWGTERQG